MEFGTTQEVPYELLSIKEKIARYETIIAMAQTNTNTPFRAIAKIHAAYKHADPFSPILQQTTLEKDKANYLVTHGISKYQESNLKKKIMSADVITLGLDTATFHQKSAVTGSLVKDLDVTVRPWEPKSQRVETHFLDVYYLSSETADIQLNCIIKTLEQIIIK